MKSIVQKKTNKHDDAVSPVVGVMLMIVITIVIAAVVALFASGLMTNEKTAPNTVVGAEATTNSLMIHCISGDELDGSLMKVIVSNPDGSQPVTTATINVGSDGKFTMGEFVNVINSVGDAGELSKLLVPGKEIRVQVTYDNNYVIMDRIMIVENGEEVTYYTLSLDGCTADGKVPSAFYSSEADAINAYLKTTSVPTPKALEKITVKENSVISVTRTGAKDDYTTSPKVVNTIKITVNGQDVAWAVVSADTYTKASGADATFNAVDKVTFVVGTGDNKKTYTAKFDENKSGYQTVIPKDADEKDIKITANAAATFETKAP